MPKFLFFIFAAAFVVVVACAKPASQASAPELHVANAATPTPAPTSTPLSADEAPRITLADAKKAFDEGNAFIVDARAETAFKQEHIKGAVNIRPETLDARLKELPLNKKIIVYCS